MYIYTMDYETFKNKLSIYITDLQTPKEQLCSVMPIAIR